MKNTQFAELSLLDCKCVTSSKTSILLYQIQRLSTSMDASWCNALYRNIFLLKTSEVTIHGDGQCQRPIFFGKNIQKTLLPQVPVLLEVK